MVKENWPALKCLCPLCGPLWLLWLLAHFVFLVLTGRTWVALTYFPSEGTHGLLGHMVPLGGSFSFHLFYNPGAEGVISGERMSGPSGLPLKALLGAISDGWWLSKATLKETDVFTSGENSTPSFLFCIEAAGTERWNIASFHNTHHSHPQVLGLVLLCLLPSSSGMFSVQ